MTDQPKMQKNSDSLIRLDHVNKYFYRGKQNEIHVINDVSLDLPTCGMVAVFGMSGCGKTTLLNVIGGLDRFSDGSVTFDGQDIQENPDVLRNRDMGYIFQNYNLCREETCYDNVADALRLCGMSDGKEMQERVRSALSNVGMENYRNRTPDTLSGGQQQRIAIARAIVKNPRVILADEPTGNLDEANTLLVMNLLREIARDRLVLLVTHEADLVDHYCETVIEVSDGKIATVRRNESLSPNGLRTKDKNDIFLGELEEHRDETAFAQVDYYGDKPETPIKLRIVNHGGKFYLRIDTQNVQVLDDTSEVRLRDGVFTAETETPRDSERIDMSELPPVEGKNYGRLYTFRSAVRSGWRANFGQKKKGKKFLLRLMILFSAVLVLMTAISGTCLRKILDAKNANSKNTFYVAVTQEKSVTSVLQKALADNTAGIDDLNLIGTYFPQDLNYSLGAGYFETYTVPNVSAHAVPLDISLASDKKLLAGRNENLAVYEVLISSEMADLCIESSEVGYINGYESLIGLTFYSLSCIDESTGKSRNLSIAGVVKDSESALYISSVAKAEIAVRNRNLPVSLAFEANYTAPIPSGSCVLWKIHGVDASYSEQVPSVGDSVTLIQGFPLTVSAVYEVPDSENSAVVSYNNSYRLLVSEEDYIKFSTSVGPMQEIITDTPDVYTVNKESYGYVAIHTGNPSATEKWIAENLTDLPEPPFDGVEKVLTPDDLYDSAIAENLASVVSSLVSWAVVMAVLCVCVYFIMRSSLLKSVREIGIYRAIGVSKKNLLFRFFVESGLLTSLTTVIGFLLSSVVMWLWLNMTPLMSNLFYYPVWLALCLFLLIVGVCLLFGILPALVLLRKTPSEILAKYDI